MSPDDIFAAQFWPWPDPAIKRDNQGRVLFVNAAFLQLYGGTVQDWTGNVVGGWPTPQGPGQAYRFETRMPAADGTEEQIYDWMEMTLADGHAFALARNITAFAQAPAPQPDMQITPNQNLEASQDTSLNAAPAQNNQFVDNQASVDQTPVADAASNLPTAEQTGMTEQPIMAQDQAQPAPQAMNSQAMNMTGEPGQPQHVPAEQNLTPNMAQEPQSAPLPVVDNAAVPPASHEPVIFAQSSPEILDENIETNTVTEGEAQPDAAVEAPAPAAEPANATSGLPPEVPQASEETPDRAYERRALPIEESAVLGNNWRDAVIAKAVGAQPAPEDTPDPEPSHNAANIDEQPNGPKRILLAEDNAINALLTRTLLEAEGHTVETVQDGQLAVEAMKTASYDLIFMDMRMPNMDGLEATRKIRTMPNVSKDLPIIALTANAFDDDRNACFDSGMNDFMTKPVSAEELSEMVSQWTKPREDRMAS